MSFQDLPVSEPTMRTGKDTIRVLTNIKNDLLRERDRASKRVTEIDEIIEYVESELAVYQTAFIEIKC